MQRKSYFLTDQHVHALNAYAKQHGLKVAEVLRRILDEWVERLSPESPPFRKNDEEE